MEETCQSTKYKPSQKSYCMYANMSICWLCCSEGIHQYLPEEGKGEKILRVIHLLNISLFEEIRKSSDV